MDQWHNLYAHILAALSNLDGLVVEFKALDNAEIDKLGSRRIRI